MTPAEAIEAAELTEAETRYRNQVGRLMYEAGWRAAEAEMAAQWSRVPRWFAVRISPSSRPGAGDLAAVSTSATRGRATFPAAAPAAGRNRARTGGRMTERSLTPEEIERADAAYRQWWLSVLTLGLIPKPEPEPELEIG